MHILSIIVFLTKLMVVLGDDIMENVDIKDAYIFYIKGDETMKIKKTSEWVEIKEKSELRGINGGFQIVDIIKGVLEKVSKS